MIGGAERLAERLRESGEAVVPAGADAGWIVTLAVFAATLLVSAVSRRLLERRLETLARRTATPLDDIALALARRYWTIASILVALLAGARFVPLAEATVGLLHRLLLSALLAVVVLAAARAPELWLRGRPHATGDTAPSLLIALVRVAVFGAGTLLVLDNLGLSITPLLTALGIGSLAVGLALQPTLANLFAGVHISMSRPLRVGDFVELEDGAQGRVIDIGWRATRLLQLPNNLLVVPNARLAEMRLVNYSLPDEAQAIVFPLGVAYGSELERVERVAIEVAREVQTTVPEAEAGHVPFLRFAALGDSAVQANVILRGRAFTDRWPVIHAFVKAIHARFLAEGIEIPFPQRTVHVRGERG